MFVAVSASFALRATGSAACALEQELNQLKMN
jgi:hypothetical protein